MKGAMVRNNMTIKLKGEREYFLKLANRLGNYEKYLFFGITNNNNKLTMIKFLRY